MLPSQLPIVRYRFTARVSTDLRLPDYAGSLLRGAFGHALRSVTCVTKAKTCDGCPLLRTCPYPAVFAPLPPIDCSLPNLTQAPVGYVIEPLHWGREVIPSGELLQWDMVLFGRVRDQLGLMILAWQRALWRGLGAQQVQAVLESVAVQAGSDWQTIFTSDQAAIVPHVNSLSLRLNASDTFVQRIHLRFDTPLRLQVNGKALPPNQLTPAKLLMDIVRRTALLFECHTDMPLTLPFAELKAATEQVKDAVHEHVADKKLRWLDWTRYSSRQQSTMQFGGVVGHWTLHASPSVWQTLLPFVIAGQWLHVGKETVFGLGRYTLQSAT
jgi:hypothetical protein